MVLQFPMIYSWRLEGRDKSDGLRLKQEGGEGEICGVKVWMESSALLFYFSQCKSQFDLVKQLIAEE